MVLGIVGGGVSSAETVDWPAPPPAVRLTPDDVHVWAVSLDVPAGEAAGLAAVLSPDERARASRHRFARDRGRWVAGRGQLRRILGRYLRRDPAALVFDYACACGDPCCAHSHRKPVLAGDPWPHFNVSHSGGLALIAVTRGRAVGIDLEGRLPSDQIVPLAPTFCAPAELDAIRAMPAVSQARVLIDLWTCKEAYLKARGLGLMLCPREVEFAILPGGQPHLLRVSGDAGEARRWTLAGLPSIPGYSAALVVAGEAQAVRGWRWDSNISGPGGAAGA